MHGRPSCSECNDKLRAQRGCRKPGYEVKGTMVWRFSSPMLVPAKPVRPPAVDPSILYECPVGLILRETPSIYTAIELATHAENGAIDPTQQTAWAQSGMRVVASERARLRELRSKQQQSKGDAAYGARALRGGAA